MRYYAYFLGTNDDSIGNKRPGPVNVITKSDMINIEFRKKIPYEQISNSSVEYNVSDKMLSGGKAVAGAIVAGPLGALVGLAMGGKKISTALTIEYMAEDGVMKYILVELNAADAVKATIEKAIARHVVKSSPTATQVKAKVKKAPKSVHEGWLRKGLIIYFTWPLIAFKKLTSRK